MKLGFGIKDELNTGFGLHVGGKAAIALPATNQIFEWFAGSGSTIPSTVSTTGDGAPVTTWTDKVASRAPTQSTAGAKPTYHINGFGSNSRASIEFDGGDYLTTTIASSVLAELTTFTLYIVYATSSSALQILLYSETNSGTTTPFFAARINSNTADRVGVQHRNDAGGFTDRVLDAATANDGNLHIFGGIKTAADFYPFFDGTLGTGATFSGATTINRLTIGGTHTGAINLFEGKIALITAYSAAYDSSIAATIKAYYGTP